MKKSLALLLAALICVVLSGTIAFADNRVPEMEIEVALRPDGSAYVTQTWSANTSQGTEFYLTCNDSGYLRITDFSVTDKDGPYTFVENWNVDASFEEKANKCGILETDKGVELCWGISNYGENRYTIEYILHGLVGAYSDADGFNHRFVDEMSFFPTDVVLTICNQDGTPLSDDFCDIWAFGYDGQVMFEDGVIRAWSESPLESGHHMTIMVAQEKGFLAPLRTVDDSFESVKDRAFEGSDYSEDVTFGDVLFTLALFLVLGGFIALIALIAAKIRKAKLNKRMKAANYFRDAPNNGNLNVTHRLALCSELCKEDTLLGAYLLKLIAQGCLESTEDSLDAESIRLRLCHSPQSGNEYEDALYTVLEAAAGSDGILQPHELKRFCTQNVTPLVRFMESCEKNGLHTLISSGCIKGAVLENTKALTNKGKLELDEVLGLKRFLLDFSLIQERGVREVVIWQEYMVYALLLGIADELAPQIRDLYPETIPQLEQYQRYIQYSTVYNGLLYDAYRQERQRREAARSSGSGGSASFGGGGGFSGGGGGGIR